MENKIRGIGWLWEGNFLRPLFWKEYQFWHYNTLPPGWAITAKPDVGADESDYERLGDKTKGYPALSVFDFDAGILIA